MTLEQLVEESILALVEAYPDPKTIPEDKRDALLYLCEFLQHLRSK